MCACNQAKGATGTFKVTLADGAVRFAKSEIEAKVMIKRAGGGSYAKA
jgi:hypothetical protein